MFYQSASWFYFAISSFALGIFVRSFYDFGLIEILWLAMLGVVVGLSGRKISSANFSPALFISLSILCFSLGALRMDYAVTNSQNETFENILSEKVLLEGIVTRDPEERANSTHLYVEIQGELILVTTEKGGQWNYGDSVKVEGVLKKPEAFETDLGRSFNYEGYLLARGVAYMISYADVTKVESNEGNPFIGQLFNLKHKFMASLELVLPEPSSGLGEGLLLGVKRALGEDLEETFRRTGIIHIIVLSGYNIMIVVYFVLCLFRSFLGRRLATVFGIISIVLFAILVGLGATVLRASVMAALLLIVGLWGRTYLALRGLFLAGFLMLLWNPYSLAFDTGFQLSFLATLGLILISPHLEQRLSWFPNPLHLREFLVATLATQIFVSPLLLYQMGQFSLVAVGVNMLVLPMVAPAMLLTFITSLLSLISTSIALPVALVTHFSLQYIIAVAERFGSLPLASFTVPAFSFNWVIISYFSIGVCLWLISRTPDPLSGWVIEEEK